MVEPVLEPVAVRNKGGADGPVPDTGGAVIGFEDIGAGPAGCEPGAGDPEASRASRALSAKALHKAVSNSR